VCDVADRYQTAASLAADLDSLIAGYRFDPKELRQFMRQLFRKEYAKELEDTTAAAAPPSSDAPRARNDTPTEVTGQTRQGANTGNNTASTGSTTGKGPALSHAPRPLTQPSQNSIPGDAPRPKKPTTQPPPVGPTGTAGGTASATTGNGAVAADEGDKPRGFWGSLFKKKQK